MNKSRLTAIMSVGILGFGLVSCSKETEIKYQQDNYKPKDIMVEKEDRSFTALNNLSNMDFSRQLVINEENVAPENKIKNLVLSTSCRSQSSPTSSLLVTNWPNPTTVKIHDILSTDILLQRNSEVVFCDISYTTTNAYGSTSTGKVSQLKIQNLNSFSNLEADHIFSQETVNWELQKDKVINPSYNSTGTIACSDFSYTQTNLGMDVALSKMLSQETIKNSKPKSSQQVCRALFRTDDNVKISKVFTLELPVSAPTITYNFSKRASQVSTMDANQKVEMLVSNPNSFPVQMKFDLRNRNLQFRAIYYHFGEFRPSKLQELPMDFTWNGHPMDPNHLEAEYMAPGNTTSSLVGSVRGTKKCALGKVNAADNPQNPNLHSRFNFQGYNMDLNADIPALFKTSSVTALPVDYSYSGTSYASTAPAKHWDIVGFADVQAVITSVIWWNELPNTCN